jgi:hypothetical protein
MNNNPKMSIEDAIDKLQDLNYSISIQTGNMLDKDINELLVAISMAIRALRLTTVEEIYNI